MITIYTDGGARGNPGPAGAGAVVLEGNKEVALVSKFLGTQTNNWAEYEALILALDKAARHVKNLRGKTVSIKMDSELIVKQMRGEYRVRDAELKQQYARVCALLEKHFGTVSFTHVRREYNARADALANSAMDNGHARP